MSIRVFLVDDNLDFLQATERFLSSDPDIRVVVGALSGSEALEKVGQLRPNLVLMDLAMNGMNGLEATRRLKACANPPCVIILTLHDNPEYRAAAMGVQADGFVAKSGLGDDLLPLIYRLLPSNPSVGEEELLCN